MIDEAQLIEDPATFETFRLLLNLTTTGVADLSILLVGTTEFLLNLPPALADRLTACCLLGPMTADEAQVYVDGRLQSAGSSQPIFAEESVAVLHRLADGLPRRLNRLADLALMIAYSQESKRVEPSMVEAAAREYDPFHSLAA